MKKLLLILAAAFALCGPVSAQSITANQFPGFGTVTGTAIQGPGVLGAATGTSLALGGASIGVNDIAGPQWFIRTSDGLFSTTGKIQVANNRINLNAVANGAITTISTGYFGFSTSSSDSSSGIDLFLSRSGAASLQLGAGDVDTAPVAQTLRTQGALAGGTSNVAGVPFTLIISPGKGTGAGGSFIVQTAPAGSTGTAVNAPVTALTIDSTKLATFSGQINVTAMTQTSAAQSGTNCYNSGTGAMTYDATLGCLTSLEETKNIQPGGIPEALPEIMALEPFWFTWKDKKLHQDTHSQPGLGAHATEKVDGRLVGYGPDGKLRGVRYTEMVALLVAAIQQQQAEIASLGAMRQCKNLYIRGLACW